jgi:hypothetical protein
MGLNEQINNPHENITSTESVETVRDVVEQLEKERNEEYPEDFLKWLEKKAPKVLDDLKEVDTNTLPEVQDAISKLDDALTTWEVENAEPEKPNLDLEITRIYEYLEDIKDPEKKKTLEAKLDKAVTDYGIAKAYPMFMKSAETNLQSVLDEIKKASAEKSKPDSSGEAAPSAPDAKEAPKKSVSSRKTVLESLKKNPGALFSEEDGTYTMLFPKKSAAEKHLQIQDVVADKYKDGSYYLQKDGDSTVYDWNDDKTPPSFYDTEGNRLLIFADDKVHVYKHADARTDAAPKTGATAEAPADAMQVVWKDETISPAKVSELIKTLDTNKDSFKGIDDKGLKRDDLISKIDLALASDQLSTTSRVKLEAYRTELNAYELQEDGKRSEKLSAAWEKEFANVAKIIDAAKTKNPNFEFNIESRGPHENNKILTLKAGGREAKIKISVWPLGKPDYGPNGATMEWDTARENGKNVMGKVLYKENLPKSFNSVDSITRTVTEWVSGVKVEGTYQPKAETPAAAPKVAATPSESRAELAARVTAESEAATAAEIEDYVPRKEILIDQPPEADFTPSEAAGTTTIAEEAAATTTDEGSARAERIIDAGNTDSTTDDSTVAREEVIAAPTDSGEPLREEVIASASVSGTPDEATTAAPTLEEFEAKEAELKAKYKLEGKISKMGTTGDTYHFTYNDNSDITINRDGSLTVVKTFPDGKVVSSVIPEDWGKSLDETINEMQPATPEGTSLDEEDVPAGAATATEAQKKAPELTTEELKEKVVSLKEKLGLKGEIGTEYSSKGKENYNGVPVDTYRFEYRGTQINVLKKPDGTDLIKIYRKTSPHSPEIPIEIRGKGQVDVEIDQMMTSGMLEKDSLYAESPESQKSELKEKFKLRENVGAVWKEPNVMNGKDAIGFFYRGHNVITYTRNDNEKTEVKITPWNNSTLSFTHGFSDETIDNDIDMVEPKETYDSGTTVKLIEKYGAAGNALISALGVPGLSKLESIKYFTFTENGKTVSLFTLDDKELGHMSGEAGKPNDALAKLTAEYRRTLSVKKSVARETEATRKKQEKLERKEEDAERKDD